MTWYANNVYANRTEALENALCEHFPGSVYRVNDLRSHSWFTPEIVHGLPDGGLLAMRPISDGDETAHLHGWYEEPVLSWSKFADFGAEQGKLVVPPSVLAAAAGFSDGFPSEGFLRFLRQLAKEHSTATLYYQSFMWGGDTEVEFAFVYSKGDEILYSFAGVELEKPQIEIRRNSTIPEKTTGDVLVYALEHIGLRLPSGYFAPHTRPFLWEPHRITDEHNKRLDTNV